MNSPKPPAPPDPTKVAAGQAAANMMTAQTQQILNQTNQRGPTGSLTYNQIGTEQVWNPLTKRYDSVPRYEAVTESPLLDQLLTHINSPFDANAQTQQRLAQLGTGFLDPMWDQRRQQLEADLLNRGVGLGTEAYANAVRGFEDARTRAYNDLLLSGQNQAFTQAMAMRNQPIGEMLAALGGQVPTTRTPSTGVAPTDYQGAVQANYAAQLANYQAQLERRQGILGAIGSLGAAAIKAVPWSDRRLKDDVDRVGELDDGTGVYAYRFKGSPLMQLGLIAQDVESRHPDAVGRRAGYKTVDYGKVMRRN